MSELAELSKDKQRCERLIREKGWQDLVDFCIGVLVIV